MNISANKGKKEQEKNSFFLTVICTVKIASMNVVKNSGNTLLQTVQIIARTT
jgi:hypothetical protein